MIYIFFCFFIKSLAPPSYLERQETVLLRKRVESKEPSFTRKRVDSEDYSSESDLNSVEGEDTSLFWETDIEDDWVEILKLQNQSYTQTDEIFEREKKLFCQFLETGVAHFEDGTPFDFPLQDLGWSRMFSSVMESVEVKQSFARLEEQFCQFLDGDQGFQAITLRESWAPYFIKLLSSSRVSAKIREKFYQKEKTLEEDRNLQWTISNIQDFLISTTNQLDEFFSKKSYDKAYHETWRRVVSQCHFVAFAQNLLGDLGQVLSTHSTQDYWKKLSSLLTDHSGAAKSFASYGGKIGGKGKNGYTILQEGYAFKLSLSVIRSMVTQSNAEREEELSYFFDHPFVASMISGSRTWKSSVYIFDQYPQEVEDYWIHQYIRYVQDEITLEEFQDSLRKIFIQMLFALHYLHSNQIVHGDLKGANMMIGPDGYLRLIDFGRSETSSSVVSSSPSTFKRVFQRKRQEDITLGRLFLKLEKMNQSLLEHSEIATLDHDEIPQFIKKIRNEVLEVSSNSSKDQENAYFRYVSQNGQFLGVWNFPELYAFSFSRQDYPEYSKQQGAKELTRMETEWWGNMIRKVVKPSDLSDPQIKKVYLDFLSNHRDVLGGESFLTTDLVSDETKTTPWVDFENEAGEDLQEDDHDRWSEILQLEDGKREELKNSESFKIETQLFVQFLDQNTPFQFDVEDEHWSRKFSSIMDSAEVQAKFRDLEENFCLFLDGEAFFPQAVFQGLDWSHYFMKILSSSRVLAKIKEKINQSDQTDLERSNLQWTLFVIKDYSEVSHQNLRDFFSKVDYKVQYHESWRRVIAECHFVDFANQVADYLALKERSDLSGFQRVQNNYWDILAQLLTRTSKAAESFAMYAGKRGGRGKNGYTILLEGYAFKLSLSKFRSFYNFGNANREEEIGQFLDHPFVASMIAGDHTRFSNCAIFNQYPQEVESYWIQQYIRYMRDEIQLEEFQKSFRELFIQMLFALYYLHSNQIVHADLKGANMMIGPDGYLRLIDFGQAETSSAKVSHSPAKFKKVFEKKGMYDISLGRFMVKVHLMHKLLSAYSDQELKEKTPEEIEDLIDSLRQSILEVSSSDQTEQKNVRLEYLKNEGESLGVWNVPELLSFLKSFETYPQFSSETSQNDLVKKEVEWWDQVMKKVITQEVLEDEKIREVYTLLEMQRKEMLKGVQPTFVRRPMTKKYFSKETLYRA